MPAELKRRTGTHKLKHRESPVQCLSLKLGLLGFFSFQTPDQTLFKRISSKLRFLSILRKDIIAPSILVSNDPQSFQFLRSTANKILSP